MNDRGIVVAGIPVPLSSPVFLSIVAIHVAAVASQRYFEWANPRSASCLVQLPAHFGEPVHDHDELCVSSVGCCGHDALSVTQYVVAGAES
jgi:hypothetical protein